VGNKNVPVLRLYRYKEAFACSFVEKFILRFGLNEKDYLFDPFCGMGTTLFTAFQKGIPSIGVDNVRFEGELLPVDVVLSNMAEEAGFKVEEIIVARYKGNSSQQMGKYGRVPVRESIVVWRKLS
jgi:hypothetical protein